jgi:glycerol-3-phosphate dehydrogenase (NAD(P)+)
MRVKIVGQGVWGNAIYSLLKLNNVDVVFSARGEAITDCEVVVLCVPTQAIRECLALIVNPATVTVINTAKGIEKDTHMLPYQIVASVGSSIKYYSLMGPSFAQEVINKTPTYVNLGYLPGSDIGADASLVDPKEEIGKLFRTDFFHVRLNEGVKALEINGAFKNIYAIACGLVAGLGYGYNTRAMFVAMAVKEMDSLFSGFSLHLDRSGQVGTIGDLIMTCSSEESRNFRFGKMLPSHKIEESLKELQTVEGYNSLASLSSFETQAAQQLPLARFIQKIITEDNPANVKANFEMFFKSL